MVLAVAAGAYAVGNYRASITAEVAANRSTLIRHERELQCLDAKIDGIADSLKRIEVHLGTHDTKGLDFER